MRLLLLGALFTPVLLAQNFTGHIKVKPLVPPLSQPWKLPPPTATLSLVKPMANASTCSIPLVVVKPNEMDASMKVVPPAAGFAMRYVTPPAPPCSEKPRP